MGYAIVLALLPALFCYGLCVVWPWLLAACRGDEMPLISSWALQIAVAPAIVAVFVGPDWGAAGFLLVPGVWPVCYLLVALTGSSSDIVAQQALALGLGLLVGPAMAMFLTTRGLVRYIPIAALLGAATVTLAVAEVQAGHHIAARAEDLGARCLSRQSFLASLRQHQSRPRRHHAEALIDGGWQIWSYHAGDFQPAAGGVSPDPGQRRCEKDAAWERNGGRP